MLHTCTVENAPKQLGDFEILRELGRGGMGVVYEARQKSLNRRVALKVLSTGLGLTTKAIMRFKREAEAAAKLHHTNIVPIYFTGDEDRVPYYAMELVDGPSLDQVIRQLRNGSDVASKGSLDSTDDASPGQPNAVPDWVNGTIGLEKPSSVSESAASTSVNSDSSSSFGSGSTYFDNVAGMMSGVADALAHAHDQGVIHRDIKPSNLLLSQDGRLSVNDFGLARILEQPGMTISGELMGSPMYMSPEQIAVGRIPLDHRTDIYSLGASLYELLTLQTPFDGQQRDQVLSQIIHKEPSSPRSINKRIPRDLETICLKAMEKDPDRRYQTADQMAKDLQCFVNRHAISARRIGPIERGLRWTKRHRALTAAIGCAVILAAVALTYAARDRAIRREYAAEMAMASAMSGDLDEAYRLIVEAEVHGASPEWVETLYGQVELSRGENEKAIDHLQKALKLKPNDVTTIAMLAEAYASDGQWFPYAKLLGQLDNATAETPQGLVFVAKAWSWVAPKKAISIADLAMKRSRSPIGLVVRSNARAAHAHDIRDLSLAEKALDDARFAIELLGSESPIAHGAQLYGRIVAADLYTKAGQQARSNELLGLANVNVKQLEQAPRNLVACFLRATYHWQNGDHDAAIAAFNKDGAMGYGSQVVVGSAYEANELQRALKKLSDLAEPRNIIVEESRAILCLGIRDGKAEAERIVRELGKRSNLGKEYYEPLLFLLLGKSDDLKRLAGADLETDTESLSYYPLKLIFQRRFSVSGNRIPT